LIAPDDHGLEVEPQDQWLWSIFRLRLLPAGQPGMARWSL